LVSCDGGVYQGTNPSSTVFGAQTWTSINGNLQATEVFAIAQDNRGTASPADDLIECATQDASANERDANGTWTAPLGRGDSTLVLADPGSDTRYFSSQGLFMFSDTGTTTGTRPPGTVLGTGGKILNHAVFGTYAETLPFFPDAQLDQGDI